MKIDKTYLVHIIGELHVKEGLSDEVVNKGIDAVPGGIADLINDELPEGLVATCKEELNESNS